MQPIADAEFQCLWAFVGDDGGLLCHFDLQQAASEADAEGERVPLFRQSGLEVELVVQDAHTTEAFHDGHPRACHASDVAAFFGIVVVVVEVEAGGAEVHLVGFVPATDFGSEYSVYAGR